MKMQKSNIAYNLTTLRQLNKFSQEEVAERIGVSRQAVAKWEAGQSVPDILNCDALAKLYDVELDDLIHYDQGQTGESIPPKGKHIFGTVRVGERGQIVLPKQARDVFKIKPGDMLVVLGDEDTENKTNHRKCQKAHSEIVSGRQGLGQARTLARRQRKKQVRPEKVSVGCTCF